MYTATKLGESSNKELQRRIFTVQFNNGAGHIFTKDFSFVLTESAENIKKAVSSFLDEINYVPPVVNDFTITPEVVVPPTPEELKEQAVAEKKNELENAFNDLQKKLITETEYDVKVTEYKTLVSGGK